MTKPKPKLAENNFYDSTESEKLSFSAFRDKKDSEIWIEFKKGSRSAFIYIYNAYFTELYSYSRQFTHDLDLIKDAIQDLFIRLNDSKERLSNVDNIKFYLYKSIKREIINVLNNRKNAELRNAEFQALEFQYEVSYEASLIDQQIDEETINNIKQAANNLSTRQREIIFYHFFEGFSISEIKDLMSFSSVQATYNLLNRALEQLKNVVSSLLPLLIYFINIAK